MAPVGIWGSPSQPCLGFWGFRGLGAPGGLRALQCCRSSGRFRGDQSVLGESEVHWNLGLQWGFGDPVGDGAAEVQGKFWGLEFPRIGHPFPFFLQLPGSSRTGEWGTRAGTPLSPSPDTTQTPPSSSRPPQRRGQCSTPTSWAPSGQGMSTGGDRDTSPAGVTPQLGPQNQCHSRGPHGCPPALCHLTIHK